MKNKTIKNPILPGFNPDPSIMRVGDDFYIATSTFQWFPGVQIHHSKDLKHWHLLTRPLNRISQLDMAGNPDSGGIWAPCLSYSNNTFYLIFTDVKTLGGNYKDAHNYLVTASEIRGPWSDPIYLNSSGFDPSLFHDDDGKKWLVNMLWDFRENRNSFAGIVLQEYDEINEKLFGPVFNIFKGTPLGLTEGSHLYKKNGYYYLMTAEGGTGYRHAVTMARSKSITGPYEVDPENPMLTSYKKDVTLQKAGHASLVELPSGECYLVHLSGRPIGEQKRCILGRETAIQKCTWTDDGWLRLANGKKTPMEMVAAPGLENIQFSKPPVCENFDSDQIPYCFQSLRIPADESWVSLKARPGWLRIFGQESTTSLHRQSLLARRVESFCCEAATCLEFDPISFQQMAGLIVTYDVKNHYYLYITHHEEMGKCLKIIKIDKGIYSEPAGEGIASRASQPTYLKVMLKHESLQFFYSNDSTKWKKIGMNFDSTILSDEYCDGFTGAFIGICVQDLSGQRSYADFDWFSYVER